MLDIDWRLLQDRQFRDLLQSLGFEARYDPEARVLKVRVVLVPERAMIRTCGWSSAG